MLLANKADVNAKDKNGDTPLHLVAEWGYKGEGFGEVIASLLAHHADVNARNNAGKTPLNLTAKNKCKEIMGLLCQHGGHE